MKINGKIREYEQFRESVISVSTLFQQMLVHVKAVINACTGQKSKINWKLEFDRQMLIKKSGERFMIPEKSDKWIRARKLCSLTRRESQNGNRQKSKLSKLRQELLTSMRCRRIPKKWKQKQHGFQKGKRSFRIKVN